MTRLNMDSGNDLFIRYLSEAIGAGKAKVALSALGEPASVSVRMNPCKLPASGHFQGKVSGVPWSEYGLMLEDRPVFTLDPLLHAGCYYVQDSSSMFVGHVLRKILPEVHADGPLRVLDLCAAPGGKTTDAAASLRSVFGDGFLLVSNEVIRSRASVLAANVALWGDPSVMVTSADPAVIGRNEGFFDIILADVPCSGEGMFRKDADSAAQWSEENVEHCVARQRRILADVWPALAEGGLLLYSTCTFNRYENDGNVRWAADTLGAEPYDPEAAPDWPEIIRTEYGYSLVPGFVKGEGQYCAVLRKTGGKPRMKVSGNGRKRANGVLPAGVFSIPVTEIVKGDIVKAVPEVIADDAAWLESAVRIVASGCAAFSRKGKDLVPCADLALSVCLGKDVFPRADTDRKTALRFLHRDTFALPDAEKGYVMICFEGHPLGFVKNLGNRCNSLHPQERRIRMDIGC